MIWYDLIWYDRTWHDMIWYDRIWYDMIWYDTDRTWYDMIWFDMLPYGVSLHVALLWRTLRSVWLIASLFVWSNGSKIAFPLLILSILANPILPLSIPPSFPSFHISFWPSIFPPHQSLLFFLRYLPSVSSHCFPLPPLFPCSLPPLISSIISLSFLPFSFHSWSHFILIVITVHLLVLVLILVMAAAGFDKTIHWRHSAVSYFTRWRQPPLRH